MDFNKIKIILRKEWAEVFKNRMVLFATIFIPLIMTALPLGIVIAMNGSGAETTEEISGLPAEFISLCKNINATGMECFQVYMVQSMMIMFMMIPLIIPVNIAAYSIVGEKTNRTLEPVLATPITTAELLTAKNLAAAIPAIVATWVAFVIFLVGLMILQPGGAVLRSILDPLWLMAVIVTGPLMAFLSVNFSLMISSRTNDPRVAEQLSSLVVLPVVAFFMAQMFGVLMLNVTLILLASVVLLLLDAVLIYFAIQLFERENILTRWK